MAATPETVRKIAVIRIHEKSAFNLTIPTFTNRCALSLRGVKALEIKTHGQPKLKPSE
ncbi:hypothetical protein ACFO5Q_05800 [Kordiimonas lipolytica]|uniref:Uncharacterized protein n=1 Tax=Kordiimonas lipolytica TaxID=1662421 RepID=A0ABV8U8W1_9PROT|nr:hypothetical protein [Kordiimonas lipolytica]